LEKAKEKVQRKEAEKSELERKHQAQSSKSAKEFKKEVAKEKKVREQERRHHEKEQEALRRKLSKEESKVRKVKEKKKAAASAAQRARWENYRGAYSAAEATVKSSFEVEIRKLEAKCNEALERSKMASEASKRACDAEITKLEAELRIAKQAQRDSAAALRFHENEQCAAEDALADDPSDAVNKSTGALVIPLIQEWAKGMKEGMLETPQREHLSECEGVYSQSHITERARSDLAGSDTSNDLSERAFAIFTAFKERFRNVGWANASAQAAGAINHHVVGAAPKTAGHAKVPPLIFFFLIRNIVLILNPARLIRVPEVRTRPKRSVPSSTLFQRMSVPRCLSSRDWARRR